MKFFENISFSVARHRVWQFFHCERPGYQHNVVEHNVMNTQTISTPQIADSLLKALSPEAPADIQNPILRRTLERVELRRKQNVHSNHTTKHTSHSSHSKGW